MSSIKIDYSRIFSIKKEIDIKNQGSLGNGEFDKVLKKWSARYVDFTKRRYKEQSGGGGEWPKLKRKRKRGKKKSAKILIDTGTLMRAITPKISTSGAWITRKIQQGKSTILRIGYGAQGKHPSGVGLQEIAHFHQTGAGNLPIRQIIVTPSTEIVEAMGNDYLKAVKKVKREERHQKRRDFIERRRKGL